MSPGPYAGLTGELPRDPATGALLVSGTSDTVAPGLPRLVLPVVTGGKPAVDGTLANQGALAARFVRAIIPRVGTLTDLQVWLGATGGNILGMVYDVGEASAGNYTKLWDGGSLVAGAAPAWMALGNPGLTVTQGQQLMLGVATDSAVQTWGRSVPLPPASAAMTLPASFIPDAGNNSRKLVCGPTAFGSLVAPASLTEAQMAVSGAAPFLIARIA